MFTPKKNPPGYKEHVIYFISCALGESVTILDWIENVKLYVCDIVELYRDTIIGHLGNSGTADLLLQIV